MDLFSIPITHLFPQKQDNFESGLTAFEQEGVQSITQYKDSLISEERKHSQKEAIEKKHDQLMQRWNNLLGLGEARRHRLNAVQNQYKDIEDLFLAFAKKASAFNSWFENAEEDLTDPVSKSTCNKLLLNIH